ncbi:ABC transporter substrate-binding protein [uncultured Victivallis sp.]|uniref:ABC transporter substrate-binding protein n=1 Tax=uncultured Victivallis sp. TaxID=354118 RepID=UPI0025FFA111|nr:ABC transporter substrate-binding protein [uncultured Victivallis sp.]
MSDRNRDEVYSAGRFQKLGLWLAVLFYVLSVVMVIRNCGGMSVVFSPDTRVITIAHWQLEDGFREGIDAAIAEYEKRKAGQGVKVKVRQVAIPVRGYPQWFLTQLIGGNPADILEVTGSSDILNQYFTPLSPYIGSPNPWNKGTPLEKMSWRESFADDMLSALDTAYSEFFSVCTFMHTTRLYVNMKLYEEATGKTELPDTLTDWLDACRKLKEYGVKQNRPIIPIGVRGFDKGTIGQIFGTYYSELCTDLSDTGSRYGYGTQPGELFRQINAGELSEDRLLEPVEVVTEVGQYFADGFPAIDLEQTKYLFFAGNVAFFIDGTWNAFSMINNAPFPVRVIQIPMLDREHRLGAKAFGRITELGSGIQGRFGIPKKTRDFELALDFLQFLTSWEINQLVMVEHCKWMSSLKEVKYEGVMKEFEPVTNTSHTAVSSPFTSIGSLTNRLSLQRLENSIIRQPEDPKAFFWNDFLHDREQTLDEIQEATYGVQRNLWSMDGTRSALAVGVILSESDSSEIGLFLQRSNINLEGIVSRYRAVDANILLMEELGKLKEYGKNGN